MPENFANRYQTALAAGVTSVALTGTVATATGVPAVPFRAIISSEGANTDEIVLVTARTGTTLTWTRAAEAIAGVQVASAHSIGATLTAIVTAAGLLNAPGVFDVRAYGATGDGVTNDRVAIQAAIMAATATGGVVTLPTGIFLVNMAAVPGFGTYFAGVVLPSNVVLRGAGRGVTTIKLAAGETHTSATEGASIIYNAALSGSGDTNLGVMDLMIDGNAANQTTTHNGITMIRTRGATFTRVTVKNVRGTASSGTAETFGMETQLGMDTTYTDCAVYRDAGSTASGFSADNSTGVHYKGCIAYGMTNSMGFTHHNSEEISYADCHAYLNGVNGFNSEESRNVTYVGCHAGGEVATGSTPWPLAAGTTLGNTAAGFVILGTKNALLSGCTSRKNTTGIGLVEGVAGASGRVLACAITDNTTVGISAATAATLLRWQIDNTSIVLNNNAGNTEYDLPTGYTKGPGYQLTTPTVPATGVAKANPYPFAVTVYIVTPGTIALLRVNGADIDIATKAVRLLPAMTINIFYSVVPTWLWFAD